MDAPGLTCRKLDSNAVKGGLYVINRMVEAVIRFFDVSFGSQRPELPTGIGALKAMTASESDVFHICRESAVKSSNSDFCSVSHAY